MLAEAVDREEIIERVAALDVGKAEVVCCVRVPGEGGRVRRVQEVIAAADIPDGPHACPKGLRHGFGVQAVSRGIALNMVQKWLGHAQLTTTAIYANAVGEEEQSIAARMW